MRKEVRERPESCKLWMRREREGGGERWVPWHARKSQAVNCSCHHHLLWPVSREMLRSQIESHGIGFHSWALEESNPH